MKPPPFSYARAATLDDAIELLAAGGEDAKAIAGGQSLVPALAYRILRPSHLVDIGGLGGLDGVRVQEGALVVGALTRHVQLERLALPQPWTALSQAAAFIGHTPIRVRGTIGGSLAHADPAAELPVVAVALDAQLVLRAEGGTRTVGAGEFFRAPFTTALEPGELVVEVRFPAPPAGARSAFAEFTQRSGDFAAACVCVALAPGWARVAVGGVGATPQRAAQAEASLAAGGSVDEVDVEIYGEDEAYLRELVETLTRRALAEARA